MVPWLIMNFIREVHTDKNYNFVKFDTRKNEEQFELGVKCIIQCQTKVDGNHGLRAQHHKDLKQWC